MGDGHGGGQGNRIRACRLLHTMAERVHHTTRTSLIRAQWRWAKFPVRVGIDNLPHKRPGVVDNKESATRLRHRATEEYEPRSWSRSARIGRLLARALRAAGSWPAPTVAHTYLNIGLESRQIPTASASSPRDGRSSSVGVLAES